MADTTVQKLDIDSRDQAKLENEEKGASIAARSATAPLPSAEKGEEGASQASISSPAQIASGVLRAERTQSSSSSERNTASSSKAFSTSMRIYRKADKEIDNKLLALDQALESDLMREQSASGELMGKYEETESVSRKVK